MNGGAGKGDTRRPQQVPDELVRLRWDYAFRKDMPNVTFEEWLQSREASDRTASTKDPRTD